MPQIIRSLNINIAKLPIPSIIKSNPLYTRFAKGVMWSFIGAVISQGLTLLASIPVARMLGTASYGELGIIQSTLAMFALFAGTSLGFTATKYISELEETNPIRAGKLIGLTNTFAVFIGGILALLLIFGAPYISQYILNAPQLAPALRIAAIILLLNSLNGAQTGTLAGLQAFRRIAKVNTIRGIITFPTMLICVWMWDLNGALLALAISAGIGIVINQYTLRQEIKNKNLVINYHESWAEWRVLFNFTLPTVLSGIVVVPITWWANVVLVNQTNGYIEMGIFNATNLWRTALVFLPSVLTQPTLPMLSNLYGIGSLREYRRLLVFNLGIVFISIMIPAIGISIAAPWIMSLYGFENDTSTLVLRLLAFAAVLSASISVIGYVISSLGKMWHGFGINTIWAVVFIGYFITHNKDALGLAIAYLVSYIVHLLIVSIYSILVLRNRLSLTNIVPIQDIKIPNTEQP